MYQITNLINGKIYIGVHRTENLDDGYMGSGKHLKASQASYGLENFKKEILEYFETVEEMFQKEAEIVNESFLLRKDVYNIVKGGHGSFPKDATLKALAAKSPEKLSEIGRLGIEAKRKLYSGSVHSPKGREYQTSERNKENLRKAGELANTEVSRKKRLGTFKRIGHSQGEKNSQFGTMWITNEVENRKIRKDEPIPDGWKRGRVIGIEKHRGDAQSC